MSAARLRLVKVRLSGEAEDVEALAALLAELPTERCAVGEPSRPYPNRHGGGERRYLDITVNAPPA